MFRFFFINLEMSGSDSGKISKKNKKQQLANDENEQMPELTKEETQIARFLRLSCPNKQGNLMGMKVDYFVGNKLVDCLMESKWGPGTLTPNKQELKASQNVPYFTNRHACVSFMQRMMNKQLFCRTVKVYKESNGDKKTSSDSTPTLRKRKAVKEKEEPSDTPQATKSSSQQQKENQQKKKFKLEMHEEQKFVDLNEPFAWVYDPTSTKTYIIGSLLIIGSIAICLFPLWPSIVREGVYYLSLAGAGFLGVILGLALFKYVLFAFIWIASLGSVHFWLLPNLTEDVGFFESFAPAYKYTLSSSKKKVESVKENDKNTTKKDSVDEEDKTDVEEIKEIEESVGDLPEIDTECTKLISDDLTKSNDEGEKNEELLKSETPEKEKDDEEFEIIDEED